MQSCYGHWRPNPQEPDMKCYLTIAALLFVLPLVAKANYEEIIVFGDSLSDNGNLAAINPALGSLLNTPPFFQGRVTNGPVAVDVLADLMNLPLTASLAGNGGNYAVAGARAARVGDPSGDLVSLSAQVTLYLSRARPGPATLIVIMMGGNDVRDSISLAREPAKRRLGRAVDSVSGQVQRLINVGARNILVAGSPDISKIPSVRAAAQQAGVGLLRRARWGSGYFNGLLTRKMKRVEAANSARIVGVDIASLLEAIDRDPDDYGFTVARS